ncbi:MAG: DUF2924 domain-containing protein [Phycisphaeraceae bacterium]|nr:DUF2924 domain-containing protein [Phycisphaeraceae bacterium]
MEVNLELKRLMNLSLPQLQDEFERTSGEAARSNNRVYLTKRILWRLQAAAAGGLSERARQRAAEIADETKLRARPPAEVHAEFENSVSSPPPPSRELPPAGSIITRKYKGRRLEVKVLDNGFELDGTAYGSAGALAKAVTGSNWNGPLFLGLTQRRAK